MASGSNPQDNHLFHIKTMNRRTIGKAMVVLAVGGAIVTVFWLLWLSSGVMDSWASKENIDGLPIYARRIGYAAILGGFWTLFAAVGHAVSSADGERRNGSD